ncbi:MAG: hypothetical protein D3924_17725, partial [Candidatus Electrothrix sp. AR4]|nr:hypothetical protein [Candidatus Electrothrix sp. AR4]
VRAVPNTEVIQRGGADVIVYRNDVGDISWIILVSTPFGNQEADKAACRMEHSVSKAIVERLVKYAEYVEKCPKGGLSWESGFGYYCKHGCTEKDWRRCQSEQQKFRA